MIHNRAIISSGRHGLLILILLLFAGSCAAQTLYKSVDEKGKVTYSDTPPADAVATESVPIAPGPSPQETEQARERAQVISQEAQSRHQELMERRQEEAEAREQAKRERAEREAAEKQQAAEEPSYGQPYPYGWWPNPHPPMRPPRPPRPVHPIEPPRRPFSHVNPPTRNW